MNIKVLTGPLYEANCYILTFADFAIVVDPCVEYKKIQKEIGYLPLKAILLTHGHADHFIYLESIQKATGAVVVCHKLAREKLEEPRKNYSLMSGHPLSVKLNEGDFKFVFDRVVIEFNNVKITVVATPGHSSCSVCYLIDQVMFTGDMLFYRSVGRTDLYSSNSLDMISSIQKLKNIKEDYLVYPGHGEKTTLFDEVQNNSYFPKTSRG